MMKKLVKVLLVLFLAGCTHQQGTNDDVTTTLEQGGVEVATTVKPEETTKPEESTVGSEETTTPSVTTTTKIEEEKVTTTKKEENKAPVAEKGLVRVESQDIIDMMNNKETFVMYLGTSYCSHCQEYKPHLENDYLPKHEDATIYYVVLDESDADATNVLASAVGLEYTPTTFLIINGEIMDSYVGSENDETLTKMLNSAK